MPSKKAVDAPAAPPAPDPFAYRTGTWHDMTTYQCPHCPWDTLDGQAAILEHIMQAHITPKVSVPVSEPRHDRFGNVLE